MNSILKSKRFWYLFVCWVSRVLAVLLAGLLLTIFIGESWNEGPPNPFTQPLPVAIELFAMLEAIFGLLVGMRWFGIGGILIIAGMIVFHIIEHKLLLGWVLEVFELIGVLYLICWSLKRALKKNIG